MKKQQTISQILTAAHERNAPQCRAQLFKFDRQRRLCRCPLGDLIIAILPIAPADILELDSNIGYDLIAQHFFGVYTVDLSHKLYPEFKVKMKILEAIYVLHDSREKTRLEIAEWIKPLEAEKGFYVWDR